MEGERGKPIGFVRLVDGSIVEVFPDERVGHWDQLVGYLEREPHVAELTVSADGDRRRIDMEREYDHLEPTLKHLEESD